MSKVNELSLNIGGKSLRLSKEDFNNAKTSFPMQLDAEGKEIKMDMVVDASADYATNAQEYFRKCMIGEEKTRSKFRQLLGVKDRVKLGGVTTDAVLVKPGACDFNPDDTTLVQKEYEVKPLMYGTNFCVSKLEQSFVSDQLKRGSNDFSQQFEFMNFFYSELERQISEQMEVLTFQGILGTNGVDGLETLMLNDVAVLKSAVPAAITDLNVIDFLKEGRDALPVAVRRKADYVYIVARNVYDALADAVSENKASGLYYLEGYKLTFQGVEVYCADGASDNTIIATYWENLVNIMDLMDEEMGFNIVDFMKTTLDRRIGVRVDFKFQPDYVNSEEVWVNLF